MNQIIKGNSFITNYQKKETVPFETEADRMGAVWCASHTVHFLPPDFMTGTC